MADFTLQALKDEIDNDPVSIGLDFATQGDVEIADILNNEDGTKPRTVNHRTASTSEIRSSITFAGHQGLAAAQTGWFEWLTANGEIIVNGEMLQQLGGIPTANNSIWAAPDRVVMNAAMTAVMQFEGSRGQELWDRNVITPSEVAFARSLP